MTRGYARSALIGLLAGLGGVVLLFGLWTLGVGFLGRGSMDALGLLFGPLFMAGGAVALLAARGIRRGRTYGTVLAVLFATVVGGYMGLNVGRHVDGVLRGRASFDSAPDNVVGGPVEVAPVIDVAAIAIPGAVATGCAIVLVLIVITALKAVER